MIGPLTCAGVASGVDLRTNTKARHAPVSCTEFPRRVAQFAGATAQSLDFPFRNARARNTKRAQAERSAGMGGKTVILKLNRQQLELLDRAIAQGAAPDRAALARLALRELAARRVAAAASPPK
jgi:hypothetical protein